MTTTRTTLRELIDRKEVDGTPSTLEMFVSINGGEADLVDLLVGAQAAYEEAHISSDKFGALICVLGCGAMIGWYAALATYDKALGIDDGKRKGQE